MSARHMYRLAAWQIDHGRIDPQTVSVAKLLAGQTAVWVTQEAVQLLGGYGYIDEYDVERFYRDAKIVEIYEGTREIEKTDHCPGNFWGGISKGRLCEASAKGPL